MPFTVEKEEFVNRTFRLSKKLVERMEVICNDKGISLNKLVVLCVNYALQDFENTGDET
ncbi:MAG: hypothetical protein FWF10_00450 [Clostridiales bacterium]|nr:hypothetical protein [Clostridiales bacterium]